MCRALEILIVCAMLWSPGWAQSDSSFTYQGELTASGVPANGAHDMEFSLWDAAAGGALLGRVTRDGVEVAEGRFTVDLDFGVWILDNSERWLEAEVNGFTLEPRTRITRSPYALQTRGIYVSDGLKVGLGTTQPQEKLHVAADNATIRLEDTSNPGGYTLIEDPQPTQLRISKINTSGDVLLDLNPEPADGAGTALVRFLRQTDTTGVKGLRLYRGDGTASLSAAIGVDGAQSFIQAQGGNFGIGTGAPKAPLDVVGDGNFRNRLGVGDPASLFGQLTVADSGDGALFGIEANSSNNVYPTIFASNTGNGPTLWAWGNNDASPAGGGIIVAGAESGPNIAIDNNEIMARNAGSASTLHLNVEGGEVSMGLHQIHPAHAYGAVNGSGSIVNRSSNVTSVQRVGTGNYLVTIAGGVAVTDVVVCTGRIGGIAVTGEPGDASKLRIQVFDLFAQEWGNWPFSFVVYRP